MNARLALARETLMALRARRRVRRVITIRLTISESKLLSDVMGATIRECDDTQKNRPMILLCESVRKKLNQQIEREEKRNDA